MCEALVPIGRLGPEGCSHLGDLPPRGAGAFACSPADLVFICVLSERRGWQLAVSADSVGVARLGHIGRFGIATSR